MPIAGSPLERPLDLAEILTQGLDTKPDADALVSRRRRWTWRMLDSVSTRLAGNYLDLGLVPGDRMASLMPNRTELMVHYLACMKCGLVAVPLNYRYMAPEEVIVLDEMPLNATGKVDRVTLKGMAADTAATGGAKRR